MPRLPAGGPLGFFTVTITHRPLHLVSLAMYYGDHGYPLMSCGHFMVSASSYIGPRTHRWKAQLPTAYRSNGLIEVEKCQGLISYLTNLHELRQ